MADRAGRAGSARGDTLQALSEELRHADNPKLLEITRMIDLLPERGAADLLLAPVRDRLASLRPPRQVTRVRLLFMPFDPVLVAAGHWKPGDLAIPRSIIRPLSALVLDEAPSVAIPAADEADEAALTRAGQPIWDAVAVRLANFVIPESWGTTAWQSAHGLTVPLVGPLIAVIRLVLSRAAEIRSLPPQSDPASDLAMSALLSDAARTGPLGWGIMLALLLDASAPDRVAAAALALARGNRFAAALHAGLDTAASDALDRMKTVIDDPVPPDLLDPSSLEARLALIRRVEAFGRLEHRSPLEQRRVSGLRQALSAANQLVFEQTLRARLPGAETTASELTSSARIGTLEAGARHLRRFAQVASRLGDGEQYERLLQEAASRYAGADPSFTTADRMRLTELLVGSDKAARAFGIA